MQEIIYFLVWKLIIFQCREYSRVDVIEVSLFFETFWLKTALKPPEIKKNPLAVSPEGTHSVYICIHVCRHVGKKVSD